MGLLKKWWAVYPKGTIYGDEERRFFIAIARDPDYKYRSVSAIASNAGLTKTRTEEIIDKYHKHGIVVMNPKNPEQWGYWETIGMKADGTKPSVGKEDQEKRIKKAKP